MALSSIFGKSVQSILPVVSKAFKCSPITLKPHLPSMITQGEAKWADLIQRRANGLPSMSPLAGKVLLDAVKENPKKPGEDLPSHHDEEGAMKTDPKMQQTTGMSTLAEKVPTDAVKENPKKAGEDPPSHHDEEVPTDAVKENPKKSGEDPPSHHDEEVPTDAAEKDQKKPRDDPPPHNPNGTDLLDQKTDDQNENDSK